MQLASMLACPVPGPSRRGRPPVEADAEQRALHLAVATARLIHGQPVEHLARGFDISPRTVQLWTMKALEYTGPLADALRRFRALASTPSAN